MSVFAIVLLALTLAAYAFIAWARYTFETTAFTAMLNPNYRLGEKFKELPPDMKRTLRKRALLWMFV
jgi:hypothetical protein